MATITINDDIFGTLRRTDPNNSHCTHWEATTADGQHICTCSPNFLHHLLTHITQTTENPETSHPTKPAETTEPPKPTPATLAHRTKKLTYTNPKRPTHVPIRFGAKQALKACGLTFQDALNALENPDTITPIDTWKIAYIKNDHTYITNNDGTIIFVGPTKDVPLNPATPRLPGQKKDTRRPAPTNHNELFSALENAGLTYEQQSSGHYHIYHPNNPDKKITTSATPSDSRAYLNLLSEIKNTLNVDLRS